MTQAKELQQSKPDWLPHCRLLRSARKSIAIELRPGQEVLIRAPQRMPQAQIEAFVRSRADWITKHWQKPARLSVEYSKEEEQALRKQADQVLPGLIKRFGEALHVSPTRVTITAARTRFGSCSAKGGISFSYRLMAYPQSAIEYVVLHELAHLKELNHSPAFYRLIESLMPDYKARAALLKLPAPGLEHKGEP